MTIIDNEKNTMNTAIINALTYAENVDIQVAFFYFSGWKLLAKYLKDKRIRILVGMYIDPAAVPDLLRRIKLEGNNISLEPYQPRMNIPTREGKRQTYIDSFLRLSNESSLLDETDEQETFKILEDKIADGTLEIKFSSTLQHGKMYIMHNKTEFNQNGDYPGIVIMGSSNFTFQGLLNQGELNERHDSKSKYLEYKKKFEEKWADSENIHIAMPETKGKLLEKFKNEHWIHAVPSPYAVYIRVLYELFGKERTAEIQTPGQITHDRYFDLEYQIDAIKLVIDKLDKYNGVILADVVGLGKSIIASAAAYNLNMNVVVIAPPHLIDQWEDYQENFSLKGTRVFSAGKIDDVYERYSESDRPTLFILDEAHRYRNEDTDDYKMLHHICNSHPDNKVILLTATPFNNDPKDVFALIKLFQIPGQSTIRSIDNLSLRFRELITRYRSLNRDRRSGKLNQLQIEREADRISCELRRLIENVVIRRSRLDLRTITRYKEDLERQKIDFAEVVGPELLKYDLGELLEPYLNTIIQITSSEAEGGFIGARYKPTTYIDDKKDFLNRYGENLDESDLQTAQTNLAEIMKRLLVMRFESSKEAFRLTLENMIASNNMIEDWWFKLKKVPIMKKGRIPDPESILSTIDDDINRELSQQTIDEELQSLTESRGLIAVDNTLVNHKFIDDVKKDSKLLRQIYKDWFDNNLKHLDPKIDKLKEQIGLLLSENQSRKIVIFSTYADTVNYLYAELQKRGLTRILKYTSADSSKEIKRSIRSNFDAGLKPGEQKNDYDVLIATDALSEGFNLHRAGVVINYDIPYNPTRVIQRIGRINRINKKVFDNLFIYNFFPTETGETQIRIKQISTLKMRLINAVVGSDTKTLTDDEKLQSFFKDEYRKAEAQNEQLSWDAIHRENYDRAIRDKTAFDEALKIGARSRVIRTGQKSQAMVAFGKKGGYAVFALKEDEKPTMVSAEVALDYFKAEKEEKGFKADTQYDEIFKLVRDHLFEKHPLPPISGRRKDALSVIKIIENKLPEAKDYCRDLEQIIRKYDGINEGDLKDISQLSLSNMEAAFMKLQDIVPQYQVNSIHERASKIESEYETIILSEDIRP